ncbi:MAG: bifunctional UDP-N-acetylmuramoyl-tripeptide:D-alanyl-D-alanine ligase/alanine racemase [Draconibacterium sp.]|nr:bifunctional UDP-N-acetylmuramoyl-tripeptide:D-alanyl-D-alanine ligase/alanine racemase [Draconibacterium sp.]
MINFSIAEISKIVGGKIAGLPEFANQRINQVITDSRTFFNSGYSLFFALTGPRNNGHLYIPNLIEKGVKTFVVSDKNAINKNATFILVENTTLALQQLAIYHRQQFNFPVIGITGSNGKTIIKEWLHEILSDQFKIVRSPKSYNSQVGVPLSVLLMNPIYNLGIFEAGISQPGEMENLTEIISPEIGIFTNIGDAHQENFHSIQQKINEKLNLFKKSKKLVYCCDSGVVKTEVEIFCEKHLVEKKGWSLKNNPALISFTTKTVNNFTEIYASSNGKKYQFKIPFTDSSSIENACHCFVVSTILMNDPLQVVERFEKLEPIAMRLEIKKGINNCVLVNDYYNSDLNSLAIALAVLHQQAAKEHLYKQVILSDIQQTGMPPADLYKRVNELLVEWKIDEVIGVGSKISYHFNLFSIKNSFYNSLNKFKESFNRDNFKSSAILIKGARQFEFEKVSALLQQKAHQTQLEINLNALVNNLNIFKNLLKPETKIMVMVKAFSYGSGDVEIAKVLQYQNVDYLAVAVADEGVQLRNAGILTPIIVMNPEQDSFQNIIDNRLEPNIYSVELLKCFKKIVSQNGLQEFPVHLKIDTGMNRLGLKSESEIDEVIQLIISNNWIKIKSIFSHLVASDDPKYDNFTQSQFEVFEKQVELFAQSFPYKIERHILNSAGIERFPHKQFDMVRLGIGLYGVTNTGLPLENIGTLKSTVSQVKTVNLNETVGYSRKGEVSVISKIAIVPLGYADGLDRKLGNKNGSAFIGEKRVPIIGNICMDMLMLDVTGLSVTPGDKVEFFGPNISILEVAKNASTIPYEILTGISQRVKRVYLQE